MFLFGSELHQYIYIFFFGRTHLNVKVRVYLLVHYPVDLTFFFFLSHQHSCFVFGIIFIVEPCSCFPTGILQIARVIKTKPNQGRKLFTRLL